MFQESDLDWMAADVSVAMGHLYAKGFAEDDRTTGINLAAVALMLLRVASDASSVVTADACRVIAVLLESKPMSHAIDDIASDVRKLLAMAEESRPDSSEPISDDADRATGLRTAAEILTQTVEEQCQDMWRLTERLEEEVTGMIQQVEDRLPTTTTTSSNPPLEAPNAPKKTPATYAGVAAAVRHPPPQHAAVLANAQAKDCQIHIERSRDVSTYGHATLNEKELVVKANLALNHVTKEDNTAPPKTTFVGARKLRSGAIVFHLSSATGAEWVRVPKRITAFLAGIGVVEFVPVSFDPKLSRAFETIEDANGIGRHEIVQARFIKPLARRRPGQKYGKRVSARKLLSEPIRCLKCQIIGANHSALSCPSVHDMCARCGEMHRTDTCTIDEDRLRACPNCRAAKRPHRGHGAADRTCPIFVEKLQFALERNPEPNYKFFLTDDPKTWERLDRAAGDINNQEASWQHGNVWYGGQAVSDRRAQAGGSRGTRPGMSPGDAAKERARMGAPADDDWAGHATRMRQTTLEEQMRPQRTGSDDAAGGEAAMGRDEAQVGEQPAGFISAHLASETAVQEALTTIREEDGGESPGDEEATMLRKIQQRRTEREARAAANAAWPALVFSDDGRIPSPRVSMPELPPLREDDSLPTSIAGTSALPGGPVAERE
ncbi:hypothetical protein B0H19DRAFT_1276208 [Mycena capillaripes]|nr:hypothetical protein B0H19DRAFT_1276208 [Mycena capillaripes]